MCIMEQDTQSKIAKMLYHISVEDRAKANADLKEILQSKVKRVFDSHYEKVKKTFSKENS